MPRGKTWPLYHGRSICELELALDSPPYTIYKDKCVANMGMVMTTRIPPEPLRDSQRPVFSRKEGILLTVCRLSHVAVFTPWVEPTVRFYGALLQMKRVDRPNFGFPGAWLAPADGSDALIHLYGEGIRPSTWQEPSSDSWLSGVVAHLALEMKGLNDLIGRCESEHIPWSIHQIPETSLTQIFFYDPNGLLLECSFSGETPMDLSSCRWRQEFAQGGLIAFNPAHYTAWRR